MRKIYQATAMAFAVSAFAAAFNIVAHGSERPLIAFGLLWAGMLAELALVAIINKGEK